MKKSLYLFALMCMMTIRSVASTIPLQLVNNSQFADNEIYVAIIGQSDGRCVYYDLTNNSTNNVTLNTLSTTVNTIHKTAGDWGYANVFTTLDKISNKTINLDHTSACRIFFGFKSPLYLHAFDGNGGYAGADFQNPTDPNHGVRWELVEFTYNNNNAIWINTSRVDAFQYPMGLELYGGTGANNPYTKRGETLNYSTIINRWNSTNGSNKFSACYQQNVSCDNLGGIIVQPSKVSSIKSTGYFDDYINRIWSYFSSNQLYADMGQLGQWKGTVSGTAFNLTCVSGSRSGQKAVVYKPTTTDVIEGAGTFAHNNGNDADLPVQAMFCGAVNRGVIDLSVASGQLQKWGDTSKFFNTDTYNPYVQFFHQKDLSYDGYTYAFAYDDTFDQSSTCATSNPERCVVTIGGFAGTSSGDTGGSSDNNISAATAPTNSASDVKSLYSDAYQTTAQSWAVGSWYQSTKTTEKELASGDKAYYNTNFNYLGFQFGSDSQSLDMSDMDYMHLDIYPTSDFTINIYPITKRADWTTDDTQKIAKTLKANQWNSIDLSVADMKAMGLDMSKSYQIKLDGGTGSEAFYLDNIYFWKKATVSPTPSDDDSNTQGVTVYTTTEDGTQLLAKKTMTATAGVPASDYIKINTNETYQSIDGFGYALTGSSCYNLMKMSAADRKAFLTKTFSQSNGYGASYVRISIGCSDFSLSTYTLCDTYGISNFAMTAEETNYVIPVLKQVMAINPNVKIIAAPWTCPKWMKVNAKNSSTAYDSYVGGHLNTRYYSDYAQYFVKFVQAMKSNGINIYAVSPQNEPQNAYNAGGALLMDYDEEADFIKCLAPAFSNAGLATKIYALDHNFEIEDYAENVINSLKSSSFTGSNLVAGAAFHNYGGDPTAMGTFHNNTGLDAIYTETSIGEWNGGHDMSGRFLGDVLWTGLRAMQNWSKAFITWNLMLDTNGKPTTLANSTIYGTTEISPSSYAYSSISYNRDYYTVSHLSSVIRPGATRCGYSQNNQGADDWNYNYVTVKNPDGTYGFVIANNTSNSKTVNVCDGTEYASVTVPAKGVVSVLMGTSSMTDNAVKFDGQTMTSNSDGTRYSLDITLTKGRQYAATGSDAFLSDNFYCDPDFFTDNGGGKFTFHAVTGTYKLTFDTQSNSFRIYATNSDGSPMTLSSDGTGALWCIGSDGVHKPLYSDITGEGWWTDTDHAMNLANVSGKKYQMTLTVGQQLNAEDVNFKFFGQAGWGTELNTTGSYHISSTSNLFLIGTGSNGHDDGNIYLADGKTLAQGDMYRFTIDMTTPSQTIMSVKQVTASDLASVAASPTPTKSASDVKSLYSDAYQTTAQSWAVGSWYQSTKTEEKELENGDKAYYNTNFNYLGFNFGSNSQSLDMSDMEYLHVDVYPTDYMALNVYPITKNSDGSTNDTHRKTVILMKNQWNSIDLSVDDFKNMGLDMSKNFQIKFDGGTGEETFYLDNIYYWKNGTTYYAVAANTGVGNATGVDGINNAGTTKTFNVYSLDGRIIKKDATSINGLGSGLYIVNRKKFVVR